MDALVAATKAHGLAPLVVPEFPGITAGGAFSGTSGESSSFREGFFDHTVNWVEMVLANGEVVKAYNDRVEGVEGVEVDEKRADLFWGAASSCGTLGVVTLLEIRLKKAKPIVELTYYVRLDMTQAVRIFQEISADPLTEFLDGIVYSRNKIVICAGRQVEHRPNLKVQRFTRREDDWFYLHVDRITAGVSCPGDSHEPHAVDYIPLTDYLFRFDRGGFWVARYAFHYFCVPFLFVTRWLLNRFMYARVMYHALHVSGLGRQYVIQDVCVPISAAAEFLEWLESPEIFGRYPLWLCPLPPGSACGLEGQSADDEEADVDIQKITLKTTLLNFGIWGPGATTDSAGFVAQNRQLERKVQSLGGKKWLYAHAYYTENEFWAIYNKPRYDALRKKYHGQHLPTLYDKLRVRPEDLAGGASRRARQWLEGAG